MSCAHAESEHSRAARTSNAYQAVIDGISRLIRDSTFENRRERDAFLDDTARTHDSFRRRFLGRERDHLDHRIQWFLANSRASADESAVAIAIPPGDSTARPREEQDNNKRAFSDEVDHVTPTSQRPSRPQALDANRNHQAPTHGRTREPTTRPSASSPAQGPRRGPPGVRLTSVV